MKEPNCTCCHCQTKFWRKPNAVARYKIHFCNKKCRGEYNKKPRTEKMCNHCGTRLLKSNFELKKSKTGLYFCDNECKNKYICNIHTTLRMTGSPRSHRGRRRKFLEAAGECQKCGYKEDVRMLDIHHADGNHHNNEWSNLRCCCVWCHQLYHRCKVELNIVAIKNYGE